MRLHPAESRIRKLSVATLARLILFDILLAADPTRILESPLAVRRHALEAFVKTVGKHDHLALSPCTHALDHAKRWLVSLVADQQTVLSQNGWTGSISLARGQW